MGKKNKLTRTLRNWHRDIGYFTVAVTLVYALSGIFLTHKDIFPVLSTYETYSEYPTGFGIAGFSEHWEQQNPTLTLSKCYEKNNAINFFYKGGKGSYQAGTGMVTIVNYKKHKFIAFVNGLHFNQAKYWKYIADFFCVCLIFLALSGLFIVKGKKGFKKRGVWFMTAGTLLVLLFLFI